MCMCMCMAIVWPDFANEPLIIQQCRLTESVRIDYKSRLAPYELGVCVVPVISRAVAFISSREEDEIF